MNKVVIVSATRTAIGKFGGSLIMGNVLSGGHGMNVARQSSIWGGIPIKVPADAVNMVCGSSLKSVVQSAQSIMVGDEDVVLAGGTESMSTARYALAKARWGIRMGNDEIIDMMINDGLL